MDLRFPPNRDVRHSLRNARRRDLFLCLQYGGRLAASDREHASNGITRRMAQKTRPARDLRQGKESSVGHDGSSSRFTGVEVSLQHYRKNTLQAVSTRACVIADAARLPVQRHAKP